MPSGASRKPRSRSSANPDDVPSGDIVEEAVPSEPDGAPEPAKPKRRARETPPTDKGAPADAEKPRRATKGRTPAGKAVNLPVLVTDETLLLPHMSIPFPVDDDEAAMVFDRAARTPLRQVLVLTERLVNAEGAPIGPATVDPFGGVSIPEPMPGDTGMVAASDGSDGAEGWTAETLPEGYGYELCKVGVIAEVGQRINRGTGQSHVILQGVSRGIVLDVVQEEPFPVVKVRRHVDPAVSGQAAEVAMTTVLEQIESYLSMLPSVPEEVLVTIRSISEPGWLADLIAFSPEFTSDQRQDLLEVLDPIERLRALSVMIERRLSVLNLRQQIQHEAQAGMDRQQRDFYLREQIRAIQKELGEGSAEEAIAREIREKLEAAGMPDDVRAKALVQVERLEQQHPFSPEIGMIRSYLEWLTELPWSSQTEERLDLDEVARILDEDHYGLTKVKERIIEFVAVRKLAGDRLRSPILCFVGPPGVGKTSLGRSVARAIGRNYARISLGGVRDEAEIRGHRRTYVGALPGRIVKALRDAGSRNPVLVLDEIDKLGGDTFRGDPSSALLEVLDPEQNVSFSDHYLEVPFDLSRVMFFTTANLLDPIPAALRDRMEIIEVPGYSEIDKLAIARNYLLPKALDSHGLADAGLQVTDDAVRKVIREYTEESGVRNLERELGSLARKVARRIASEMPSTAETTTASAGNAPGVGDLVAVADRSEADPTPAASWLPAPLTIDEADVETYLGVPRYEFGLAEQDDEVGVATGAAVTSAGGDLLSIEVLVMEGKGELVLTGQLGDVMQESARAAISYARSRSDRLGLEPGYFDKHNVHIHIPAGAIPKDGPSAGITMASALVSALTGRMIRKDVAMTGEITLRGKVLPIGGLREKTLAAHRGGIRIFILPRRNAKDVSELPPIIREELELVMVDTLDEVLAVALVDGPALLEQAARRLDLARLPA